MRLFFKHLIRDTLHFPLQAILIILTLTLSVSVGVGSFKTQQMFVDRALWLESASTRLGDIVLTPGASDMRMIFDSDVEALLEVGDRMFGEFRISALTESASKDSLVVSVSGADFENADSYFEIRYVQYSTFTSENVLSSAILSENAAKELGKGLGDSITLSLLDSEISFTVRAIAESNGVFEDCDVMVPIDVLQRVLSKHVPAIAVLGEAFTPYTRIALRLGESTDADALLQKIHENENLQHCGVELSAIDSSVTDMRILAQTGSIFLISSVLIILCVLLCLTSLRLLEGKRRQDYALFSSCGASELQINTMRISESLFYSLIAAAIGIPLSKYIIEWVGSLVVRPKGELTVGVDGCVFGLLLSVVLSVSCTVIHILKLRSSSQSEKLAFEEQEKKRTKALAVLLLLAIAALFACALLVKRDYTAIFCVAVLFTLVVFALLYTPSVTKKLAASVSRVLFSTRSLGKEALVFRAIENNYSLRHLCMILTVSLTLIISIGFCQSSAASMVSLLNSGLKYDHLVLNSDPTLASHIKDEHNATRLCEIKIFTDAVLDTNCVVIAISAYGERDSMFGDGIDYSFPEGKKIVISKALSKLCAVGKGDTVTLKLKGQEHLLEVADIAEYKALAVFFDANSLGIRPDMCAFDLASDESSAQTVDSLREELELNGATLTNSSAIFGRVGKTGHAFLQIIKNALYVSIVLAFIGTLNSALSTYRRRRHEFEVLSLCGMSRAQISRRIAAELICTALISSLIALPFLALSFAVLELGASSFGLTLL